MLRYPALMTTDPKKMQMKESARWDIRDSSSRRVRSPALGQDIR
jgi:hypothetical protein